MKTTASERGGGGRKLSASRIKATFCFQRLATLPLPCAHCMQNHPSEEGRNASSHFTDEETKTHGLAQGHTATQGLLPGSSYSEAGNPSSTPWVLRITQAKATSTRRPLARKETCLPAFCPISSCNHQREHPGSINFAWQLSKSSERSYASGRWDFISQ